MNIGYGYEYESWMMEWIWINAYLQVCGKRKNACVVVVKSGKNSFLGKSNP